MGREGTRNQHGRAAAPTHGPQAGTPSPAPHPSPQTPCCPTQPPRPGSRARAQSETLSVRAGHLATPRVHRPTQAAHRPQPPVYAALRPVLSSEAHSSRDRHGTSAHSCARRRVSHRTAPAGEQAPALPGPGSGQQPNSGAPTPRGAQSHEDTPERSGSQPRGPAREGAGCPNPASHDRQAAPPLPSAPPPRSQTRSTEPGRRCLPTPCGNRPGFSPDRRT